MATIAAAVLARDEADVLDGCLASLDWADELLVVVDAATRDGTVAVARRHTDAVAVRRFDGFPHQRNAALDLAATDWVFFVDADERCVPALASEIRRRLTSADEAGFWVPRRNLIAGRWVRHAGWWPDRQLRLLRRGGARFDESRLVHEVARLDGSEGGLREPLLHLNYETMAEFRQKQAGYAALEARAMWERGVRARPRNLILQPLREFRRRYVELAGYREGMLGLELALSMALASLQTYRALLRQGRVGVRPGGPDPSAPDPPLEERGEGQRPKRWMPVSEAK